MRPLPADTLAPPRNREQLLADAELLRQEHATALHNAAQARAEGLDDQATGLATCAATYERLAADWQALADAQGSVP